MVARGETLPGARHGLTDRFFRRGRCGDAVLLEGRHGPVVEYLPIDKRASSAGMDDPPARRPYRVRRWSEFWNAKF
jgi:hypothetical protein